MTLQLIDRGQELIGADLWPIVPSALKPVLHYERASGWAGGVIYLTTQQWVTVFDVRSLGGGIVRHAVVAHNFNVPSGWLAPTTVAQEKVDARNIWPHWRLTGTTPDGVYMRIIINLQEFGLSGADVPNRDLVADPWTPGGYTITDARVSFPSAYAGLNPVELEAA